MNQGKAKCEKLKAIRRAIAEANNIDYNPSECTFEGECSGTCPKCDAEAEHLNQILAQKEANGEDVVLPEIDIEEKDVINENAQNEPEEKEAPMIRGHLKVIEDATIPQEYLCEMPDHGDVVEDNEDWDNEDWDEDEENIILAGDIVFDDDLDEDLKRLKAIDRACKRVGFDIPIEDMGLLYDPETGQFVPKKPDILNGLVEDDSDGKDRPNITPDH